MMRCVCLILVLAISAGALAQTKDAVRSDVATYEGKRAKITLHDGNKIQGKIRNVSADSFTIQPDKASPPRTLTFAEVQRVSPAGMTRKEKWIVFAVVWFAIGAIGGALNH